MKTMQPAFMLLAVGMLSACGGATVTPTPSGTPDSGPTMQMDASPDAVGVCFVDFPCANWQRFSCEPTGGYRALRSFGCEAVCPPGPCSGGVCRPTGDVQTCPAGTRCVMHSVLSADDRATPCEAAGADGSTDDAVDASADAASCPLPASAAACASDGECSTIARQCYCGAQPVDGVNTASLTAALACEARNGMNCALGCAVFNGRMAQDGRTVTDGGVIAVRCDRDAGAGRCVTFVRP